MLQQFTRDPLLGLRSQIGNRKFSPSRFIFNVLLDYEVVLLHMDVLDFDPIFNICNMFPVTDVYCRHLALE